MVKRLTVTSYLLLMVTFVIRLLFLPKGPDNMEPAIGQAAVSMRFGMPAGPNLVKVRDSPNGFTGRGQSQLLRSLAILTITRTAKFDIVRFTGGDRHGASTGDGGQDRAMGIALAMVAEHDQKLRSQELSGAGNGSKDWRIRVALEEQVCLFNGRLFLLG